MPRDLSVNKLAPDPTMVRRLEEDVLACWVRLVSPPRSLFDLPLELLMSVFDSDFAGSARSVLETSADAEDEEILLRGGCGLVSTGA
jgi:hypothetical protein